jgi:hypothetical protein
MGLNLALGFMIFVITSSVSAQAAIIPQQHLQQVVVTLLGSVTLTFSAVASVVFYFSCRCGLENFDLEYLVASVVNSAQQQSGNNEVIEQL